MGDSTIAGLPAAAALQATDVLPIDQGGVTGKVTLAQIAANALPALAASSGSSLVGFIQSAIGALATTVQAHDRLNPQPSEFDTNAHYVAAIQAMATNKQFASNGAIIQRFPDRVFVGDAINNDGTYPNITQDWLSAFQVAQAGGPATGTLVGCQMAVLANQTAPIGGAFIAGARTLNFTGAGVAIANTAMVVNDNAAQATTAYAYYAEAHRMNNVVGVVVGMELDTVQRGSLQQMNPYGLAGGGATALQLAAGAGLSATGQFDCTAALVVGGNPMKFDKGIVFLANGISGTDGATGTGYAMALAKGHIIQWFNSSGLGTGYIFSNGTSATTNTSIQLNDNLLQLLAGGQNVATFRYVASAVNYIDLYQSATNNAVQIAANGTDTNIGFNYFTKGTGGHSIITGGGTQFVIGDTPSATNHLQITGSAGGNPTITTSGGNVAITPALVGASTIQGTQLISTIAIGTAPFLVTSTTAVANLTATNQSGGTVSATTIAGSTSYSLNGRVMTSSTNPTIGSGFGTSPSIPNANGTAAFRINVGTGGTASSGVLTMPTASNGWILTITASGAPQAAAETLSVVTSATSCTITNYTIATGAALAWPSGTVLDVKATAF